MTPRVAQALLRLMHEGGRVVYVEDSPHRVRESLAMLAELAHHIGFPAVPRFAHGQERLIDPTGRGMIIFTTVRSDRIRGHEADVIYCGASTSHLPPQAFGHMLPALAASPFGALIRA